MCLPAFPFATRSALRRRLDQVGLGLAGLCALHCIATLVLVSALGLGGHFLMDEQIHRIGLVLALGVAALALGWGLRRHRRRLPFVVALAGLALMAGALMVPHGPREFALTLAGVGIVGAAHWLNLRAGR